MRAGRQIGEGAAAMARKRRSAPRSRGTRAVAEAIAARTATWKGLLAAEGCAYAVLVRGRGTDGRDDTEGDCVCIRLQRWASQQLAKAGGLLWTRVPD